MTALALGIVLVALSPEPTLATSGCAPRDNLCRARKYEQAARSAGAVARAKYLESALRSYLEHHAQTRDAQVLCDARRTLRARARLGGEPHQLAQQRRELRALEAAAHPVCGDKPRATKSMSPPAASAAAPDLPTTEVAHANTEEPRMTGPSPGTSGPSASPTALVTTSVPVPQVAAPDTDRVPSERRPGPTGRGLVISGGASLGAGLVLLGVAGYGGARLGRVSKDSFDLYESTGGQGDAPALAEEAALRHEHARWLRVTVGTSAAGAAAVILGAVLVRAGKQRAAAVLSRAALVPIRGGLALVARF
jgi:hypothetical protein